MMYERPFPRFPLGRAALIVVLFAALAALVVWLSARYDSNALPALLFVAIIVICHLYYHRRRCPDCRSRLSVRREYIGNTQQFRLMLDCPRCQITWDTGDTGDDSNA